MQRSLVMTVLGRDRPGLVRSVAALVAEHGGNWLESRMSRLGGHFAGILRIEAPLERADDLSRALQQLEGLQIVVYPDQAAEPVQGRQQVLDLVGQDRPGIVRQIAKTLAAHGVNVEELDTECSSAAMSGETLFKAHALLKIPAECDPAALRRELERIAEDLIVDISLAEVAPAEAAGKR
jgi:glycine cleavage system regulatory protein